MAATRSVEGLRSTISGAVIAPGDPGYDTARSLWNGTFDRRPAVIVCCSSPADVAAAIGFAEANGLEISVRGGGHSFSGASAVRRRADDPPGGAERRRRGPAAAACPGRRGRDVGGRGRGHAEARARRDGRRDQRHRRRRSHPWRRDGLARQPARVHHRQPGVGGGRARRRSDRPGVRDRASRPVLGPAGRRRQLRCGHRVRPTGCIPSGRRCSSACCSGRSNEASQGCARAGT